MPMLLSQFLGAAVPAASRRMRLSELLSGARGPAGTPGEVGPAGERIFTSEDVRNQPDENAEDYAPSAPTTQPVGPQQASYLDVMQQQMMQAAQQGLQQGQAAPTTQITPSSPQMVPGSPAAWQQQYALNPEPASPIGEQGNGGQIPWADRQSAMAQQSQG